MVLFAQSIYLTAYFIYGELFSLVAMHTMQQNV